MQPRILIARLSAIGDCIETLPIANALKDRWPECSIRWVVDCAAADLLDMCPAVDEVLRIPKGFLKQPGELRKLRRWLREDRTDIAIDPQGLLKSAVVAWLSGAGHRIGFSRPQARELSPWLYTTAIRPSTTHLIDKQLELLRSLEILKPKVDFGLRLKPVADETIANWLNQNRLEGRRFVIANPGAGWPSRLWPVACYAELANSIFAQTGLQSVITWAGIKESEMADSIVKLSAGASLRAAQTALPELASLIARASVFVSSDTGPMHLASALGIPCVSLFGPTRPQESGPYGSQHICIQQEYQAGSSRERRAASNAAMRAISVNSVLEACLRQLASK